LFVVCFALLGALSGCAHQPGSDKTVGSNAAKRPTEPSEYALILSAKISESPPAIRLEWLRRPTPVASYAVYRKTKEASSWGTPVATLDGNAVSYEDTDVAIGQTVEYKVQSGGYAGYVWAGIKVPPVEFRGKVVLLVEAEQAAALSAELETLKNDLIGDGWIVLRHDVSRNATPQSARALIQADYDSDPANVKAVFLLGHIPVFKSGKIAPDGHRDHLGPWPADAYYGSMAGSWDNSPSAIPGDVELQVGRVDFDDMPAFQKDATELLRQYLDKNHKYRFAQMRTTRDAFVSEGFGRNSPNNAAPANAYRLFSTLWGNNARIVEGAWAKYLPHYTFTWGHINGPGGATSCAAVGGALKTSHLAATQSYGIIFTQTFGSYFGDWNLRNNFMRAFLAMPDHGLASMWTGRPNWFFHHMALGETIGYSTQLTQNNKGMIGGLYTPTGMSARLIHIALMGDPTLRMFPVSPAANLRVSSVSGASATLKWGASADRTVADYYVYGASTPDGPYVRLGIVNGTTWTHTDSGNTKYYMVRASKLTVTGSGSFYNLSQGVVVPR